MESLKEADPSCWFELWVFLLSWVWDRTGFRRSQTERLEFGKPDYLSYIVKQRCHSHLCWNDVAGFINQVNLRLFFHAEITLNFCVLIRNLDKYLIMVLLLQLYLHNKVLDKLRSATKLLLCFHLNNKIEEVEMTSCLCFWSGLKRENCFLVLSSLTYGWF